MTGYWWGVATVFLLIYLGFGFYVAAGLWPEHPSAHWRSQFRSPYAKAPLTVRSWAVFLLLWIPTPLLWPLTLPVGKFLYYRYRRAHNEGCARAEEQGTPAQSRDAAEPKGR